MENDPFSKVEDKTSEKLIFDLKTLETEANGYHDDPPQYIQNQEKVLADLLKSVSHSLPPLLNEQALFTKNVCFGDINDLFYHSPSNRIGTKLSPKSKFAAGKLFEEVKVSANGKKKAKRGNNLRSKSPDTVLEAEDDNKMALAEGELPSDQRQLISEAIMKYHFYIEHGIREEYLAPYQDFWKTVIFSLVPPSPPRNVSQEYYDNLIRESLEDIDRDYKYSAKKAIVDYVVKDKIERERLFIQPLEVPLTHLENLQRTRKREVVWRELPYEWHENVDESRERIAWTLQTLSRNAIELSNIWHVHFEHRLLVDVSSSDFLNKLPFTVHDFQEFEVRCCEHMRGLLYTSWLPKNGDVFRRIIPICINGDAEAYYRSISILQSNQLHSLVLGSMKEYVDFLEKYEPVDEIDPTGDNLLWARPPLFKLKLHVKDECLPVYEPSFSDVEDCVCKIMEGFIQAVKGIPKVGMSAGSRRNVHINVLSIESDAVSNALDKVCTVLQRNAAAPKKLLELFDDFLYILSMDLEKFLVEYDNEKHSIEEYGETIDKYIEASETVQNICTNEVRTGLFLIDCVGLKTSLSKKAQDIASKLLDQICSKIRQGNLQICDAYSTIYSEITKSSKTAEDVLDLKAYIKKSIGEQEELQNQIAENKAMEGFLFNYRFATQESDFSLAMKTYEWPKNMVQIMRKATQKATQEHRSFEDELKGRRSKFSETLLKYEEEIQLYEELGSEKDMLRKNQISTEASSISQKLEVAMEEAEEINRLEKLFGWPVTKFTKVNQLITKLEPFLNLWNISAQFYDNYADWMNGPFSKLDPEEITADVGEQFRRMYKLCKIFGGSAGGPELEKPLLAANTTIDKIKKFQENLPLMSAICNEGLRSRHWTKLSEIVGFEIKKDETTSFSRLLDRQIAVHYEKIQEVSDFASREWTLEKTLDKMDEEWNGITLDSADWKETGTYILKGGPVDEAQTLLDDHIVKTQAMTGSPFAVPFKDRLDPWEKTLLLLQDILDQWLKCQSKWIYLEPIFGSEEIMKQIPKEGAAFRDMDLTWREVMEAAHSDPVVMNIVKIPNLLDKLTNANECLDVVEKGLNDFLETKKVAFPRLYFLSNDELLEILSEGKIPLNVQPFVKKCFESMKDLQFKDSDGTIIAMNSVEGETVPFPNPVDPEKSRAVEVWLLEVEEQMRGALHKVAGEAIEAYVGEERSKWILEWPGQLVLNCSQVHWTSEVNEAILKGGAKGLQEYSTKCTEELNKIVDLVRGDLSSLERKTCGALVVIDVHARDVVQQMADDGVSEEKDFKWQSQLRYYWEQDDKRFKGKTIMVRMINAEAYYGYEYYGNSGRLVITPLTDRCYRTLMGAIHMCLGGAPAGPAGTGKTETTKDLAKALAIQCVVFNCSDGLDYKAMGKFFKGLACSGAWACFDEFNRIELEVLSVVAQQVLTIQRAVAAGLKKFMFEGSELKLVLTCNVFITMNPGYAGRSELPDNLKALFRDVAMMVPDYALIAEIILYSFGYLEARPMARKLVQTYKLCSEQLSSQDHYDYGMRAVMAVLRAAGNLKRSADLKNEPEDALMLKAIIDVNLPKFLDQDVPLFEGILSDLFPGVSMPEADYVKFREALTESCKKYNLQPLDTFFTKVTQLYEMIIVRHGLMIVGESFGMKTSAYKVLATALTDLHEKGLLGEQKTKYYVLNPKSVTMGQLYGQDDPVSKEWTDGVLAVLFRNAARDTSPDRKWLMFDGPVDAIWIENMNTVLDDNKKLCLNSGEIVAMAGLMNMIFEVADLAVASPATVSRCGMVYVQPSLLGWRPPVESWMNNLPPGLTESHKEHIMNLFDWLVPPALRIVTKMCKMPVPLQEINLIMSLTRLLESLFDEFKDPELIQSMNENLVFCWLQCLFLFSLVWSVGSSVNEEGRKIFDKNLRKILLNDTPNNLKPFVKAPSVKLVQLFPDSKSVFDFTFEKKKGKWLPWLDTVEKQALDPEAEFTDIIVQTVDTVRYTYLVDILLNHGHHCMVVGPTGTGKSVYVKKHLQYGMDPTKYSSMLCNFSAQTSANMTQDIIDGKLDKRRKGVFGPPIGKKMMIFVDDVNMPQVEVYGAQPPIEILRQWMDHSGWYDRKELTFRTLLDIQFIAAMGPPGGGRNAITNRFTRHFSVMNVAAFDTETLSLIFSNIVDWWMSKCSIPDGLSRFKNPLVQSSIHIYQTAQKELLPTPTKSHYTFNLRDLSKVFQGIVASDNAVSDSGKLVRLWTHETFRVYYDRLIDDQDRQWMLELCHETVDNIFKEKFHKLVSKGNTNMPVDEAVRQVLFANFMIPGQDPRKYDEVESPTALLNIVQEYLGDFNATSKSPMQLVLFLFALEHISRICRVISMSGGHALLVGLGGSGRQSLAKLAAFIEEYTIFQVEMSRSYTKVEWHEDLKKVLKLAGEANKKVVFLFSDTQIKEEGMVEDISNLLNTYEVPNLFVSGDLATIFENIRVKAKQAGMDGTRTQLYNFFLQEIKKNFHIILSFSPVGDDFRERLRKFPALVNCCTIDWFTAWPQDALASVATEFLDDLPVPDDKVIKAVQETVVLFHSSIHKLSTKFKNEMRRINYVTPTSYLELLAFYKEVLNNRQTSVMTVKKRYEVGLEKLEFTESSVQAMQEELVALQPQLVQSTKETEEAMEIIAKETVEADKVKSVVEKEEAAASAEAAKVQAIKTECESDLAEALPLLEGALKALDTLTKGDIAEVKGMKSPPAVVKLVMEAVCVIKGQKPARVKDKDSGKMVDDYWETSKKLIIEANFLQSLKEYDKDNIPPNIITKIRVYVQNPDFDPEKVKSASKAAYGLCSWVRAMESYDRVAKVVAPKKIALAQAEKDLEVVLAALKIKQDELQVVLDKLAALDADLTQKKAKKEQLEADVELCKVKLDRAQKLIAGLGGEKTRWTQAAVDLGEQYKALTGDCLLGAGQIAYLGPFTATYRDEVLEQWTTKCKEEGIQCSPSFSLVKVLGDPVKIRAWNIQGLPKDDFSTENAISLTIGRRWPLCIDPQGLANKWIRNMEKERKLYVVKLTDSDYLRTLETCIQYGNPVLLENVGESLDPTLEGLLQKQLFKQGGVMCIKLGDAVVEYSKDFKFYMTTKLRNPHYPPEICVKVNLLNFVTTPEGLEDQLLGIVVAKERPDLEEEKNRLIITGAENKKKLKEIEDEILRVLSTSEGNILEDQAAVEILQKAKMTSDDISEKQKIADETEAKIDEARKGYKPIAKHCTILFFCVTDLANIDPMYQYSLAWFVTLFVRSIADSEKSEDLNKRLKVLADHFTYFLYLNVCRSLFEKDKLLFAFLLTSKLEMAKGAIDGGQLRFLLTGGVAVGENPNENPAPGWISTKMWDEMCRLSAFGDYEGLKEDIANDPDLWKPIYDASDPTTERLTSQWEEKLTHFQKLLVLRSFRPDKIIPAVTNYVSHVMGEKFVAPIPFNLEPCFKESDAYTPLLFILSPGSDPMANLLRFAEQEKIKVESVSLGQGQGPVAMKWIEEGIKDGFWVVLQNCHLAKSFLPTLESVCEKRLVPGKVHENFRLWLTSYPSPLFPIPILEKAVKMTNEAPKGLKAGLLRTYLLDPVCESDFFDTSAKDNEFRKLLFSLAFFHSVIVERKKFGPIGFNIPYQFNENDLRISIRQLKMFLDEYDDIPFPTLSYTCGECNYGGKVTDGHDRHTLMTLLDTFYNTNVLKDKQPLSASGDYTIPEYTSYEGYLDIIKSFPLLAKPEVFGLHDNADISKDLQESNLLLESLMLTQSSDSSGGGMSYEETVQSITEEILSKLSPEFDIEIAGQKFPQDYHNSMNTVLVQELGRFNRLLTKIKSTMTNLGKALKGLALMNDELDVTSKALFDGKIPPPWMKRSFPSLKPVGSYIKEVQERVQFFNDWIDKGEPVVFWIPGFFFTQAFLTASKQNYARRYTVEIDKIDLEFVVKDGAEELKEPPKDGVYAKGIFIEACKWDEDNHVLGESDPKVLFTHFPTIWMFPTELDKIKPTKTYNCPLYKTTDRRGVLSTTGHSTNFVCDIRVPVDCDAAHWTRRGVAMFLALPE